MSCGQKNLDIVAETTELAERLAELSQAGLPLPEGLRAAAADADSVRLAGVLRMIAAELDAGVSLEIALGRLERRLPAYVQGVVRAGVRSGQLPALLTHMAAADRHAGQTRREIRLALAYPALLLTLMVALVLFVVFFVLPNMELIYDDFETEMPALTNMLLTSGHLIGAFVRSWTGIVLLGIAGVGLLLFIFYRAVEWAGWSLANPRNVRSSVQASNQLSTLFNAIRCWPSRLLGTFPLVGPLMLWGQVASWARLLSVLVEARVPLSEALSLAAEGTRSANLADLSDRLAEQVRGPKRIRVSPAPAPKAAGPWRWRPSRRKSPASNKAGRPLSKRKRKSPKQWPKRLTPAG